MIFDQAIPADCLVLREISFRSFVRFSSREVNTGKKQGKKKGQQTRMA